MGAIYSRVASRYGVRDAPEVLERRFHEQWQKTGGLASLQGPATPDLEKQWWRALVRPVFQAIEPEDVFEKFFDELYETFGHAENWRLFPEAIPTLAALKAKGFRMGIISNWDSRLMTLIRDMGLEPYFDFILISAVVGHSKPGKKIFHDALKLSGCEAAEAIHVGDSLDDDYRAALSAGLQAIHLDRRGQCKESIPCIKNLEELLACMRLS